MKRQSVIIRKICPICGVEFFTYPSINSTTCNPQCGQENRSIKNYKKHAKICKVCGIEYLSKHPKGSGPYCSHKCHRRDVQKPFIYRQGYKYLFIPDHPCATKQGYYKEHRYIMEQHIKRVLKKNEIVHHINHIRDDNRIENLMILNNSEHRSYHAKNKKRNTTGQFSSDIK